MFKLAVGILAVLACAAGKPHLIGAPLAYTAPAAVVAAPAGVVTATSSQYVARNHNGIATAPVVAPVVAASAPLAAAVVGASLAYSSPLAGYSRHLAYSAPLNFAAAPAPVLL